MRTPRRRPIVSATTAVALALAVPSGPAAAAGAVTAASHDAPATAKRALRADSPADKRVALRALRRARTLLTGSRVRTGRELTPALTKLALSLPALTGADLRAAKRILARPTDGFVDSGEHGYTVPEATPICAGHFCVHYVTSTEDAPSLADTNGDGAPDQVQNTEALLNGVWQTMIGTMGWREPMSDGPALNDGGDGRVDVYLAQLGHEGIYGYAAPDPQTVIGNKVYGYLVLDDDYSPAEYRYSDPFNPRAVTSAHEFNHLVQFNYDVIQDLWMQEATSTWFEEAIFPAIDDYLQYVGAWAASPGTPITTPSSQKVYGDAVWSIWLANRLGPAVIERSWANSLLTYPEDLGALAYDRGIADSGGQGIEDEFGRFTAAVAEWQAPGSGFPDGPRFPDVARAGTLNVDGEAVEGELDHGSFALFDVPYTGRDVLTLEAEFPEDTAGSIALVARMPDGSAGVQQKAAAFGGPAHVTITGASQATRMTAVLANTDFRVEGFSPIVEDWVYEKDSQDVSAQVLGRAPEPLVLLASPTKQKLSTVTKRGLLVSAYGDFEVPVRLTVQVEIKSRYLRESTVVGRAGPITIAPGSKKQSFRVKLSKAARRALARRRSTNLAVKAKFTEPTGTATQRDSDTIKVVR